MRTDEPNENYDFSANTFAEIVNNNAPLKKTSIKRNQPPFMIKKLRKEIYVRSRFRNKLCKNLTKENEKLLKIEQQMRFLSEKMHKRIISQDS